jgi:hypothetical protein
MQRSAVRTDTCRKINRIKKLQSLLAWSFTLGLTNAKRRDKLAHSHRQDRPRHGMRGEKRQG